MSKRVGFLSGAPRVSTHVDGEASGPRAHILGVVGALRSLGWEVHTYIAGDRVPRRWTRGAENALRRSVLRRLVADVIRLAMGHISSRRAWRELRDRVDWVYERFAVFQALGRRPQRHGLPWILETNGPFFSEARLDRKSIVLGSLARRLELSAYRDCDVLVCVTDTLKEIIVREARVPSEKIIVVSNAVDTDVFDPAKYPARQQTQGVVIGFVGALIGWQGLDLLLDALAETETECPDVSLQVVGDGPLRGPWEAKARALGLSSRVRFEGSVPWDRVPAFMAGIDIGYSGQVAGQVGEMYHSPLKLYEYMAMARPVIAAAFDDARRVVQEGETGFLFQPAGTEDLKRALRCAYEQRAQLSTLGRNAREVIVADHTWVARVRFMIPEIERVLHSQR